MKIELDAALLESNATTLKRIAAELAADPQAALLRLEAVARNLLPALYRQQRKAPAERSLRLEAAEKAAALCPRSADDVAALAFLLSRERVEESLLIADRAVALAPDRADLFRLRASLTERLGRYAEAQRAIARALELAPGDAECRADQRRIAAGLLEQLREIRDRAADLAAAIAAAEQVVELCPDDGEEHRKLAQTLLIAGRWQEALRSVERAQALDPQAPGLALLHATVLERLGLHREAGQAIRNALSQSPEDAELQEAALRIAQILQDGLRREYQEAARQDQLDRAVELAEELLSLAPDSVSDILALVGLLSKLERYEDALNWAVRALELDDRSSDFHSLKAALLIKLGRPADAEAAVRRGLALVAEPLGVDWQSRFSLKQLLRRPKN